MSTPIDGGEIGSRFVADSSTDSSAAEPTAESTLDTAAARFRAATGTRPAMSRGRKIYWAFIIFGLVFSLIVIAVRTYQYRNAVALVEAQETANAAAAASAAVTPVPAPEPIGLDSDGGGSYGDASSTDLTDDEEFEAFLDSLSPLPGEEDSASGADGGPKERPGFMASLDAGFDAEWTHEGGSVDASYAAPAGCPDEGYAVQLDGLLDNVEATREKSIEDGRRWVVHASVLLFETKKQAAYARKVLRYAVSGRSCTSVEGIPVTPRDEEPSDFKGALGWAGAWDLIDGSRGFVHVDSAEILYKRVVVVADAYVDLRDTTARKDLTGPMFEDFDAARQDGYDGAYDALMATYDS